MTDTKLLTLPAGEAIGWLQAWSYDQMCDYALANVLHHTAPLRYALENAARDIKTLRGVRDAQAAEIEALRAEREVIADFGGENEPAMTSPDYNKGYERAANEREALIVGMLAMLQDLYDGYGWDNLAMDMGEVHDRVDGFGIEHEVTRNG